MSVLSRLFGFETAENNLRIIIARHGERADLALGPNWIIRTQNNGGYGSRISYLTPRADFREWNYDPPLTVEGERQSMSIGRKLLKFGYPIDYCYSSPAYRSIQTAEKILESQGRKAIPINIEPGLFECPSWYEGTPLLFIPPENISMDKHFNINSSYTPIYNDVDITEDERQYYKRSRQLIDSIIQQHKNQGGTILLSAHAGSIEALTRGILRRSARPERLQYEANKVNYCNFALLERDARTKQWSVHLPISLENPYGGQRLIQSSIPLHSATSHYLPTAYLRNNPYGDSSYRYRYRYRYR